MVPNVLGLLLLALTWAATPARAADPVRLGLLHTLSPAPFYIARERSYFSDAGIDLTFRFFESAQPIAAAAVARDVDVGVTALTGGFFNLAEKGTLTVIGGALHEEKGYEGSAVLASDKAYTAGLTALDKLPGHSVAITQYGSSFHYIIGRIAEAEGFDLKSVTLRPVQQVANMVAAVGSGQVDATIAIASLARPLAAQHQAHILGWVGDIVPYQITAVFTTPAMIAGRPAVLVLALFPIPKIALVPLFIIWFGIGEGSKIATLVFGVVFPTVIATAGGVDNVPRGLIRMGQSFGLSRRSIIRKIVLRATLPAILSGFRVTTSIAIVLLVAAEMIGAEHGIGAFVLSAGNLYDTDNLMAGTVVLSVLGLLVSWLIHTTACCHRCHASGAAAQCFLC